MSKYLLFVFVVFLSVPAFADCVNPPGASSQTRYDFVQHKMFVCNGTSWLGIPGGDAGGFGCVLDGVVVENGASLDFYSAATHANCNSIKLSRTCTNGVLDGSATYQYFVCSNADTTPDAFSFNDVTNAPTATLTTPTPATVTISGINASTPVSVSGQGSPQISINGGGWVTSGTIANGQTIAVRLTSAAANSTAYAATIDVGGVTDVWTVTTIAGDTTPDAFSFNDVTNAPTATLTTPSPATVTITGINTPTSVSVSGQGSPQISINGGAWTTSGTITNGQTLAVRLTSDSVGNTEIAATVTVGTVNDDWLVKTQPQALATYIGTTTNTSNLTTYTFSNHAIGDPRSDRLVVVIAGGLRDSTNRTINSLSINGVAASRQGYFPDYAPTLSIYSLVVPTGTTANISVTFDGVMDRAAIGVYTIIGYQSAANYSICG